MLLQRSLLEQIERGSRLWPRNDTRVVLPPIVRLQLGPGPHSSNCITLTLFCSLFYHRDLLFYRPVPRVCKSRAGPARPPEAGIAPPAASPCAPAINMPLPLSGFAAYEAAIRV